MSIFSRRKQRSKGRRLLKLLIIALFLIIANKLFIVEQIVDYFIVDNKIVCNSKKTNSDNLSIHLLDVGQSESILVTQGNQTMLIDTSTPSYGKAICKYIKKLGIKKIDLLILTHPHIDHTGGASKVLRTLKVKKVIISNTKSIISAHNLFYLNTRRICLFKGIPIEYSKTGSTISFGKAKIKFVAPLDRAYDNMNNYSIGIKLTYGNFSSLLLSDAQSEVEDELMTTNFNLNCDILKISHHGSITSSTSEFIDYVKPKYAILSVGESNTYGHPTKTVMKRFESRSIPVYRTDEQGTIIITTDGNDISFNTKSGDYKYRKKKK